MNDLRRPRPWGALALLALLPLAACEESAFEPSAPSSREPAEEAAEPKAWLEYELAEHDFGELFPDALRQTRFPLVAVGEEDVVIEEIHRTCGCLEGRLEILREDGSREVHQPGQPYPPGTRFELIGTIDTKGKSGQQHQQIYMKQTGRREPYRFTLKADIKPFLNMDPPMLALNNTSTLAGGTGHSIVSSRTGEPFRLDCRREPLREGFDVSFSPIDPDADGRAIAWRMDATVERGVERGQQRYMVLLTTDVANEQAPPQAEGGGFLTHGLKVWVTAEVEGVMLVRPERLMFAGLEPGRPFARKCSIRNRDPEFDMSEIEVGLYEIDGSGPFKYMDSCKVDAKQVDPGRAWDIEVTMQDLPVEGTFNGVVVIRTKHPLENIATIPFTGDMKAPRPATDPPAPSESN